MDTVVTTTRPRREVSNRILVITPDAVLAIRESGEGQFEVLQRRDKNMNKPWISACYDRKKRKLMILGADRSEWEIIGIPV